MNEKSLFELFMTFRSDKPFIYEEYGISREDFNTLTAYQKEVINWAVSEGVPFFKDKSDDLMDMMERLEYAYEVNKGIEERKKTKRND